MRTRTTIELDEQLLQQIRMMAASRGVGLSSAIADLLRAALFQRDSGSAKPYRLDWPVTEGGLQPGVVLEDRDRLYDVMDGRG